MKPVVETTTSESHSCVNEGLSYSRPGWTSSVVLDTRLARKRRVATLTAARCWKWLDIQTRYHLFFCISKCFQKVFHAGKCRCQAFCDCSITTTFVFFLPNLVNIHLGVRPIDLRHFKLKAMRRHEWRTWRRRRRVAEDRADDPDHHRHLRRRHRHRAHRQPPTSSGWAESLTECLPSSSSSSSLSSTESFGFISTPFSWQLLFYRCLWSRSSKKADFLSWWPSKATTAAAAASAIRSQVSLFLVLSSEASVIRLKIASFMHWLAQLEVSVTSITTSHAVKTEWCIISTFCQPMRVSHLLEFKKARVEK